MTARAYRRDQPASGAPLGIVLGVLFGLGTLYLFGEETRFAVYGLLALVGLAFVPTLVRRAGSIEGLLFVALLLSLQIDVAIAYNFRTFKPAGPYGILISPILLAAIALLIVRLVLASRRLARPLLIDRPLMAGVFLMLLAGALSSVNTPDRQLVSFGLFELVTLALVMTAVVDQSASREGLRRVQQVLAWTLVIQSLLIIGSFATGVQISLSHGMRGEDYGWGATGRFAGTLNTPSAAGTFLAVCLISALTRLFQEVTTRQRHWLYLQLGLGGFALLLTQTRTAWIGLILAGAGVLAAALRRREISQRRVLQLAGLAVLTFVAAWPFIAGRVEESHSDDAEVRWRLVTIAAEMIKAHPVVGIGLNTATSQVRDYAGRAGAQGWVFIVHNQFLLVWAETGIFGILGFLWLFRLGFRSARALMQSGDVELRNAGLWLFWSFAMLVWALSMDHVSGAATYKLVFVLFAVARGVERLVRSPEAEIPALPPAPDASSAGARAA